MLGFMGVTAFLSMWISNTATTAMMAPIVQAILDQLNAKVEIESSSTKDQSAVPQQEHRGKPISIQQSAPSNILASGMKTQNSFKRIMRQSSSTIKIISRYL